MISNLSEGNLRNEPIEVTANYLSFEYSSLSMRVLPGQVTLAKIKVAQSQDAVSQQFLEASTAVGSGLAGFSLGLFVDIFAGKNETERWYFTLLAYLYRPRAEMFCSNRCTCDFDRDPRATLAAPRRLPARHRGDGGIAEGSEKSQ